MSTNFTNSELEAFLDEALPIERMTAIEEALRNSDDLQTIFHGEPHIVLTLTRVAEARQCRLSN